MTLSSAPAPYARLVDEPFAFVKAHRREVLSLSTRLGLTSMLLTLPAALLSPLMQMGTFGALAGLFLFPAVMVGAVLGIAWQIVVSVVSTRAALALRRGETPTLLGLLRGVTRGPALGVAAAKLMLYMVLGLPTCGLALLVMPLAWGHALAVAEMEGLGGLDALKRSWWLVAKRECADGRHRSRFVRSIVLWHAIGALYTSVSSLALLPTVFLGGLLGWRAAAGDGELDPILLQWVSAATNVSGAFLGGLVAVLNATLFLHFYEDLVRTLEAPDLRAELERRRPPDPAGGARA